MTVRTAEEARKHHVSVMGEDLGSLYHRLWNEVAWLYTKWEEYVELFGTKPSRIDLLNKAAGQFFRVVQDTLWDDTLLHIARLTDPPHSAGRANLTIQQLPPLIQDKAARQDIERKVAVAKSTSEFCRDWRNRRIAHSDLDLAMSVGAEPLPPASRDSVHKAMESVADVLNAVALHFMDSTTSFEGVGSYNGARNLLYVLDDGLKEEEERRKRFKAGEHRAEDYQRRDL